MQPLSGVLVVSAEQAVAGPFATRQLADLGARVIKIERPGTGDFARSYDTAVQGLSSYFVWCNRSKESMTLNLKVEAARGIFERLLDRADVLVHNLSAKSCVQLALSTGELRKRRPRLITCAIGGYGADGPLARRKAYDLLVQCEAGLLSVTGTARTPVKVGISVADIAAGMYAYTGILAALYHRAQTGQGTSMHVTLLDALAEWMSQPAYYARYTGEPLRRSGAHHATIAPYGPFVTADGETLFVAVQNDGEWSALCREVLERTEVSDDPRFATNEKRVAHRRALHRVVGSGVGRLPLQVATSRLDRAGIAYGSLRSVHDLWAHPQLEARGRLTEVNTPTGNVAALLPPVAFDDLGYTVGPVPRLGQHTDAILASLGYGVDEIATLHREGSV